MPSELCWRPYSLDKGVVVATDQRQEWILPWWWKHYSAHNAFPVTFVDCGMSEEAQQWCTQRGECVLLKADFSTWKEREEISPKQIALWEGRHGSSFWAYRKSWFYKPFALLLSPYCTTLWLDLDCQVRSDLSALFDKGQQGIALHPTARGESIEDSAECSFILPGQVHFNSGVIVCPHGHPLILQWAQQAISSSSEFMGDEHLLSRIIHEGKWPVEHLSQIYNCPFSLTADVHAHILHFIGDMGKELIGLECRGVSF